MRTQVGLLHHGRHGSHIAVAALARPTGAVGGVGGTVLRSVARDIILVGVVVDAQSVVRYLFGEKRNCLALLIVVVEFCDATKCTYYEIKFLWSFD